MFRMLQGLVLVTGAGLALCLVGCSSLNPNRLPETGATLEGTVTYGQQKLPAALIIVVGKDGSATGKIGEDSRYKVNNVPLGEVTIAVNTAAAQGEARSPGYKGPQPIPVDSKYHDPATSGIKTTIDKGANTYDIVIPK
jgi:hypothetical protein